MISRRTLLFALPALLATAGAGTANAQHSSSRRSSAVVTRQALTELNRYRQANRRNPLIVDPRAEQAALAHSREMALLGDLTHADFNKRMREAQIDGRSAENVALGQQNVAEVLKAWKRSRGHRNNMLGPYNRVGLAVARNANSGNRPYWTLILAQ